MNYSPLPPAFLPNLAGPDGIMILFMLCIGFIIWMLVDCLFFIRELDPRLDGRS